MGEQMLSSVAQGRLRASEADVGRARERRRQRRLGSMGALLAVPAVFLWVRILQGKGLDITQFSLPHVDPFMLIVGEKEAEANTASVREQAQGDMGAMSPLQFKELVQDRIRQQFAGL